MCVIRGGCSLMSGLKQRTSANAKAMGSDVVASNGGKQPAAPAKGLPMEVSWRFGLMLSGVAAAACFCLLLLRVVGVFLRRSSFSRFVRDWLTVQ